MGAEVQAGGVRMNMIPKDGGNVLRGGGFAGGTAESWQSNNVDDSLKSLGLVIPNGVQHVQDFNAFVGGPIKENKLWFFGTGRHVSVNEKVANSFYRDGVTQAIVDQCVRDALVRLTLQAPYSLNGGGVQNVSGVSLIAPGTKYEDRWNQLDLSVRKTFQFGRKRIQPQLAIFNTLNGNVVLAENEQFGTALPNVTTADGRGQPRNVLQGRMLRLAVLFEF